MISSMPSNHHYNMKKKRVDFRREKATRLNRGDNGKKAIRVIDDQSNNLRLQVNFEGRVRGRLVVTVTLNTLADDRAGKGVVRRLDGSRVEREREGKEGNEI